MEEEEDDEDKEKPENFYRLICLVVDLGTEVLLKLFLKYKPQGQTVKAFLNSKANVLNILKNKKVFNDLQLGIINAASPDMSCFDISLLYILIANLTNVQPPNGGWYITSPIPSDQSAGALLMNLRRVRNEAIAHRSKGKMKKSDFEKYWNDTKDILIKLAGEISQAEKDSVKDKIDRNKKKQLVGDKGYKLETLLLWAKQDQKCEILSSNEGVSKKLKTNTDQLETNTDQVKTNTDQLKTNTDMVETNTDQLKTNTDQLETNTDQVKTNTDQLETNTDQVKTNTDQLKTNTDIVETNTDMVKTNTDQVKTNTDQVKINTDQLERNTDQVKTNTDQVKTNTDQVKTNTDQVKTNTDQLETNTDQVKTHTDQVKTNTDQLETNTDQVKTNTDQVKTNTDQVKTNTDQVKTNTDQLETNTDQVKTNTDQLKTNTDQVKTNTDQVKTNTDQLETNTDQVKTHTDQVKTNTDQLETNTDQVKTNTDQVKTNTDQVKTNTDQVKTNTDQVKTNTDQLKTNTDQLETNTEMMETNIDQLKTNTGQVKTNTDQLETNTDQVKKNTDQVKTNTDQLKTLTDHIRQIAGTSLGTESSVPELIYNRPKKRTALKPVAKFGAKRIKKSHEDEGNFVPDQKHREYVIMKEKLRTEIIEHYKVTGCCTKAVPALLDGEEVHIDKMFVMPSMSVRKNMATGTEGRTHMRGSKVTKLTRQETEDVTTGSIKTIHELFEKDGQSLRRMCVSGDAGQGKTTLCQKIVSAWCKVHGNNENVPDTEHQFLKSFDLLFYLPLRNNKLSDVIEMIKTEIVREASHEALKQVLEKESEICLIILDGLDEWLPSTDCKHKVPYMDPREKFTVLITSRPWKLEVLRPTMSEIGQEVELNGIKKDTLIKVVVNLLNNKYMYAKERYWKNFTCTYLNKTYKKVEHLAEIPIILTQMVCMWYDDEEFGNTRVEIYSKMLDYLFHVAAKRHQKMPDSAWMQPSTNKHLVNVFKDLNYCEMYSEILFKLSGLAYYSLFNKERKNCLVFPHSVTEIYELAENDVKFCLFVGILSQTKSLCKASSHTKNISFLHKTFQEFLAVLYIAYGGKERIDTIMLQTLNSLDDVFEMSQVLIFLSGLRPDLLGDMSRHIAHLTNKDERVRQYRNSFSYKKENSEIIHRIQNLIYECFVEVPDHRMLNNTVELQDIDEEFFQKFDCLIPYLKIENIKSFSVSEGNLFLVEQSNHNLFKFRQVSFENIPLDYVTSIVERCSSSLTCLAVLSMEISDWHANNLHNTAFVRALHEVSHLTCIMLSCLNLTHPDIEYLGEKISQSTQLREISLETICCATCQDGQCNHKLDLSHHKQLQDVTLCLLHGDIILSNEVPIECFSIDDGKCAVSIINTLKSSTSLLEFVFFSYNEITLDDRSTITVHDCVMDVHPTPLCLSKVLTDVIPTLKNLRKLYLFCIDFKQDILRLSPEMTSLKEVYINESIMTLQCLQDFIDSLPQTQFDLDMSSVSICPEEDEYTALTYITDRHQLLTSYCRSGLRVRFTNRPPH